MEAVWTLVGAGKATEARAALATLERKREGWEPPVDLLARLALAESRTRLVNASDLKQPASVVSVAAANPALLNCEDIDVLWRLAEAFAATARPDRTADVYAYILDNCTAAPERAASLQKASLILDRSRLDALLGRPDTAGVPEVEIIRLDLARRPWPRPEERRARRRAAPTSSG